MKNEDFELPQWEKELLDERLKDYYENSLDVCDIRETIRELRETIV
jgi:hypothetical protein